LSFFFSFKQNEVAAMESHVVAGGEGGWGGVAVGVGVGCGCARAASAEDKNCEFSESGVAQWLACWAHNPKVRGSRPRSARAGRQAREPQRADQGLCLPRQLCCSSHCAGRTHQAARSPPATRQNKGQEGRAKTTGVPNFCLSSFLFKKLKLPRWRATWSGATGVREEREAGLVCRETLSHGRGKRVRDRHEHGEHRRRRGGAEPLRVSMPRELKSRPSTSLTHPGILRHLWSSGYDVSFTR